MKPLTDVNKHPHFTWSESTTIKKVVILLICKQHISQGCMKIWISLEFKEICIFFDLQEMDTKLQQKQLNRNTIYRTDILSPLIQGYNNIYAHQ